MIRILIGAAAAATGYMARRRGFRVLLPWRDGIGTLGFHVSDRTYFDFYRSFGRTGIFWCKRDADGNVVCRGWFNLRSGSWKIESGRGVAQGKWSYLRSCKRYVVTTSPG